MSEHAEKPTTIRIDLTEEQARRVSEVLGQARLVAQGDSIEMSVEELESRIVPKLIAN